MLLASLPLRSQRHSFKNASTMTIDPLRHFYPRIPFTQLVRDIQPAESI
jgi:hypothetical protein